MQAVPADLSLRPAPSSCLRCPCPVGCLRWCADSHATGIVPSLHPLCCRSYATADDAMVHSFQCSRIRQSYITVDDTFSPLVHNLGLVDSPCPFPTYAIHIPASSSHHSNISSHSIILSSVPIPSLDTFHATATKESIRPRL